MSGPFTFPMTAATGGTGSRLGVQVVLDGSASLLELELQYVSFVLRGGFGTTGAGAVASEGARVWVRAIGTGIVTPLGGRGEVTAGHLMGYLAAGEVDSMEGDAIGCDSLDHSFTLRPR